MNIKLRSAAAAALLGLLAGCSNLPNDGPSVSDVKSGAAKVGDQRYALVDIDYRVAQTVNEHPAQPMATLGAMTSEAPTDLIQEGDSLEIGIYTPGAGPMVVGGEGTSGFTVSASSSTKTEDSQSVPRAIVERGGTVNVPYAGEVGVVGMTPAQASEAIRRALHGKAVNPQVVVAVISSPANSVTVLGEVHNSGRYPVSANSDRILDAIAEAGGVTQPSADLLVTVQRGTATASISLADLLNDPSQNIRLAPRDQVRVTPHIRRINAFGALGKVSEVPMVDDTVSLATALSRSGGLDTQSANPTAVMVFRFERPEVAQALGVPAFAGHPDVKVPIVYRLDLKAGQGFFVASKFTMQPDDTVFVARANLAEIQKFFTLVNIATQSFYQEVILGYYLPRL